MPVLPSGVVDRLEEDEESYLPNITVTCTEAALYGKFCDWVLEPSVDLPTLQCEPSDRWLRRASTVLAFLTVQVRL